MYSFEQAFHKSLQVIKSELEQAFQDYGEHPNSWKRKQRYLVYKHIVERLDSLI